MLVQAHDQVYTMAQRVFAGVELDFSDPSAILFIWNKPRPMVTPSKSLLGA